MVQFVFGIEEMDEYYGGALAPKRLVVLKGHPGSGKTLLASTICVANAVRLGHRCLYISLQEDEEKFVEYSQGVGLRTIEAIRRGLLRFVRLPLVSSEEGISEVLDEISRIVSEYRPRVIVVDSVSPLLQVAGLEPRARSLLQNYFYNMPSIIDGIVVLIAEIPLDRSLYVDSGIDFVADIVIHLKGEVKGNLLVRKMEIVKMRGQSIYVSDFPFKITNQGIHAFLPPLIENVPPPGPSTIILDKAPGHLGKYLSRVRLGESIYVKSGGGDEAIYLIIAYTSYTNKAKTLLVSFRRSEEEIREMIGERLGASPDEVKGLLENMVLYSINPAEKSFEESLGEILHLAKRLKPQVLAIDGIDIPLMLSDSPNEVLLHARNLQLTARTMSCVTLMIDYSEKPNDLLLRLSDIVIVSTLKNGEVCLSAARKGKPFDTQCISQAMLEDYRESLARSLRKALTEELARKPAGPGG